MDNPLLMYQYINMCYPSPDKSSSFKGPIIFAVVFLMIFIILLIILFANYKVRLQDLKTDIDSLKNLKNNPN